MTSPFRVLQRMLKSTNFSKGHSSRNCLTRYSLRTARVPRRDSYPPVIG